MIDVYCGVDQKHATEARKAELRELGYEICEKLQKTYSETQIKLWQVRDIIVILAPIIEQVLEELKYEDEPLEDLNKEYRNVMGE